ncbi:sporulation protein YunB [Pasteuria penetrans]|uniref:sporulation protein YunB n=1 Tax=Pasteuria penetrans TaxID=86005 RepID=UPI00165BC6DA|nr:sporulation protein YunB [Pasteuria penetrans]
MIPIVLLLVLPSCAYGIWKMEGNLRPMLLLIAQSKVKKIAQQAMLEGVREIQAHLGNELNGVMQIEKEQKGRISFVQVNAKLQASIYEHMVERVQQKLGRLREQIIEIKIGQILQSQLLSDIGPSISVQMWPKGASKVSIIPHMESQGINMVMVTLQVRVYTEMGVIVPFTEEHFPVSFSYPLAQALVVGDVPETYYTWNQPNHTQGGQKETRPFPPRLPMQKNSPHHHIPSTSEPGTPGEELSVDHGE